MLKLSGSVCILMGGAILCRAKLQERREYLQLLRNLISALRQFGDAVRISHTPLPDVLEKLRRNGDPSVCRFFETIRTGIQAEDSLPQAWQRAVSQIHLSLRSSSALEEIGQRFAGDDMAVLETLRLAAEALHQELDTLERTCAEDRKRITAFSLSTAILLIVLLL